MKNKKNFFLIVGVSKSGTTALGSYLSQHNHIFFPSKINEPRFFVKDIIKKISYNDPLRNDIMASSILNEKQYYKLFNTNNPDIKYFGEDSIHYFNHPEESIKNILKHLGDIPIIIILRNPIDRLVSNWKYIRKDFLPLANSLANEKYRKKKGYNSFWDYKNQSLYYDNLKLFKDSFSNVKVIIFEEFISDPKITLKNCLKFLDLKDFEFDTRKIVNKTKNNVFIDNNFIVKLSKYPRLYNYFANLITKFHIDKLNIFFKSKNQYGINRRDLYKLFENDIMNTEKLLKKDLKILKY